MKPEIIYLARDRYAQEHKQFNQIAEKAGRIIVVITLIISLLTAAMALFADAIFSPRGFLEWTILLCQVFALFCLVCAWGHALLAIKFGANQVPPFQKHEFDHLQQASREGMYRYILSFYVEPSEKLADVNIEKAKYLKFSYEELAIGGYLLAILLILFFVKKILQ